MFRYVAFSWLPAHQEASEVAARLEQALRVSRRWTLAFGMNGQRVYMTGAASGINGAYRLPTSHGVILGRLFRRDAATPNPASDVAITEAEAQRIVRSDGRELIEKFWGRYIAFLPSWTGEPRVLRDPTGTLPCYRIEIQGVSIVLSWLEDLSSLLDVPMPSVDWEAAAAHMALGQVSGRRTLLEGVTQLLAGELTPMATGRGEPLQLWSAVDCARSPASSSPTAATQRLRDTVEQCVGSWASCYESIVLRLSGGVDSAILLAHLAPRSHLRGLTCLNYYSPGTDSDERSYARLAAQKQGATLLEQTVDDGYRLTDVLDVARTPIPANYLGSMGTSRTDAAVAALHQAGSVFNGAGGDQLFFEMRCTWPAADYLKLRGFGRGFFGATLDAAHLGNASFWKSLRQAVSDQSFRGNPVEGAGKFLTLTKREAIDAALQSAHRFVHPGWLAAEDLPIGKFHQLGMVISPLEYYNHYLREAAPERVHPLMSQPLMELCLATPTFVLTHGGRGRGLARSAFADLIPAEIARRRSKGGAEDYIATVLKRNLPFAREMLMDGVLMKHGLLDRAQVESALAGRPGSKATYMTEIHACIATEAWLQRATTRAASAHA
ncbi:asparagine synthase C-terminal domain-containing protein [Roseateles saccharophilus]|uniref:asparagine synthase (glutamine-hydrolyzing) n=1 Tax=Roseateles saccharophilus TaxID=304 RepID=A0A4R3U676_ROSSA|nr:asparagine synthase C-terminal domain-containing protein [Roseateles saccharophilus]MDG0835862.1 asparagine synthetase B family protein [Roseateles saccharophilus]TCU83060.1 asparagine synthase (glutamine-hydrolysing) [Roseateles saccharophilus]